MAFLVGLMLLASCSLAAEGGSQLEAQLDRADATLDEMTSKLVQLQEQLEKMDTDEHSADIVVHDMGLKLDLTEGSECGDHFGHCDGIHQCVNKMAVCDGTKDCKNGADEAHCEPQHKEGDVFHGGCEFNKCGNSLLTDNVLDDRWIFRSVETSPYAPWERLIKWDNLAGQSSIFDVDAQFSTGVSHYHVGSGSMIATYQSQGGVYTADQCQTLKGGDVIWCRGYRASLFGEGEPCYRCFYWKEK